MAAPPASISLAELQSRFALALRASGAEADAGVAVFAACVAGDGLPAASRVQVYRNNSRAMFDGALGRTYPVLRSHVGEERFASLAAEYRDSHPSRSGDLHWVGAAFPAWLASRLAGTPDEWLTDMARLEWACEEALVAELRPATSADTLARIHPADLADVTLALQPALRLVESSHAVWSAWRDAQGHESGGSGETPSACASGEGDVARAATGPQCVAVVTTEDGLVLHALPAARCRFIERIAAARTIEQAMDESGLRVEDLPEALAWLFSAGLVTSAQGTGAAGSRGFNA